MVKWFSNRKKVNEVTDLITGDLREQVHTAARQLSQDQISNEVFTERLFSDYCLGYLFQYIIARNNRASSEEFAEKHCGTVMENVLIKVFNRTIADVIMEETPYSATGDVFLEGGRAGSMEAEMISQGDDLPPTERALYGYLVSGRISPRPRSSFEPVI